MKNLRLLTVALAVMCWCFPATAAAQGSAASTKQTIRAAQQRLLALGYEPGAADGAIGAKTVAALKKFQMDHGLAITGTLDTKTTDALNGTDTSGAAEQSNAAESAAKRSASPTPAESKSAASSGPPTGAILAVYWKDGDSMKVGTEVGKGDAYRGTMIEQFVFDKKTWTSTSAASANSNSMKVGDSPIPLVMTGMNFASFSGSVSARYANVFLDLHALTDVKSIPLGVENEGSNQYLVSVRTGLSNGLFVSPDYIVFPEGRSTVGVGGPFARAEFSWATEAKNTSALLLVVFRNGKEIARTKPGAALPLLRLTSVKNRGDGIDYRVLDQGGKTVDSGSIGFPVAGAVPDIVEYTAVVTDNPAAK